MRLVFTLFSLEYVCIAQTLARLYATLSHASNLWFTRKKQILFLSLSFFLSPRSKLIYFQHLQCNYKWQQKIKINDSPISVAQCMWTGAYRRSLSRALAEKCAIVIVIAVEFHVDHNFEHACGKLGSHRWAVHVWAYFVFAVCSD